MPQRVFVSLGAVVRSFGALVWLIALLGTLVFVGPAAASATYPGFGELPFWTFSSQQLTDRMDLQVNVATGNLILHERDLTVNGRGLNLVVDRFYNSLNAGDLGALAYGWTYSIGPDVRINVAPDGSTELDGPSGYIAPFGTVPYTTPTGLNASLSKDPNTGNFTLTFNRQQGLKFSFDSTGRQTAETDAYGNTIQIAYSSGRTISGITDTQGRSVSFGYDGSGHLNHMTLAATGNTAARDYAYSTNSSGNLASYTDPAAKQTSFVYDGSHHLTQITDPMGRVVKLVYDSSGRVTSVKRLANVNATSGPTTTYTYNAGNTVETDPNGHKTTYTYDGENRVTKTTDALGHSTSRSWSANSDPATVTLGSGAGFQFGYSTDGLNDLTSITSPDGTQGTFKYLDTSAINRFQPTDYTDPQGNLTKLVYDTSGGLSSNTAGSGGVDAATASVTRNPDGTVATSTDGDNHTTTYSYDGQGNLKSATPPGLLGSISYGYDGLGRLTSVTDGNVNTTTYSYDVFDRLAGVSYADGSQVTYVYDDDGNQTSRTTSGQGTSSYGYDPYNRLTSQTTAAGTNLVYGYDNAGNLTSFTDPRGKVSYGYDAANNLKTLTEPGGAVTSFLYNANNQRTTATYPNGVKLSYTYVNDSSGHPTMKLKEIKATKSTGAVISDFTYIYTNGSGSKTDLRQSVTDASGNTTTYTYDGRDQLKHAVTKNSSGVVTDDRAYTYDGAGNRTQAIENGTTTTTSYDASNELNTSTGDPLLGGGATYSYDQDGQLTSSTAGRSLTYNVRNQQTAGTNYAGANPSSYAYEGPGQGELVKQGTTVFTVSQLGDTMDTDSAGNKTFYTREPDGQLVAETTGGATYYYTFDGLGSTVALTDSGQNTAVSYTYDPFGFTNTTGTLANRFKYAGGYLAATGLYHFGQRWYDPRTDRWTQEDPLNNPLDLREGNRFAYVGDDPINSIDPTGMSILGSIGHFFSHTLVCAVKEHPGLVAVGALGAVVATGGAAMFAGGVALWAAGSEEGLSLTAELGGGEAARMLIAGGSVLGGGGGGLAGVAFGRAGC